MTYEVQTAQFAPDFVRKGYRPVRASDGYVMIAAVTQRNFASLCDVVQRPDLLCDVRFAETSARWRAYDELHAIIEEWSLPLTGAECEQRLAAVGVPAAQYSTVPEYLADAATRERVMVPAVDGAGDLEVTAVPFRLTGPSGCAVQPQGPARVPELGADTRDVLADVLGAEDADELLASGSAREASPRGATGT